MGGFFGAVSDRNVALDVFFGTDYHSHLGTRRGGMVLFDKEEGFQRRSIILRTRPFGRSSSAILRISVVTRALAHQRQRPPAAARALAIWASTPL